MGCRDIENFIGTFQIPRQPFAILPIANRRGAISGQRDAEAVHNGNFCGHPFPDLALVIATICFWILPSARRQPLWRSPVAFRMTEP
jgi:hypothetical protein